MDVPARLGILTLDTRFPRIPGDVGSPHTWPFPVTYATVKGATPDRIVRNDSEPFVQAFIAAGQKLVAQECDGIATTCGFLSVMRPRLAQSLGVPVAASALEQAAQIRAMLPVDRVVGILTISAASLTEDHLRLAGVPEDSIVRGVDDTRFAASILENQTTLDVEKARESMISAALRLVSAHPKVGAILLECTNMPPYAADISRVTARPVFSIVTYLQWFHAALTPPCYQFPSNRST